jgi:hypothetical protein
LLSASLSLNEEMRTRFLPLFALSLLPLFLFSQNTSPVLIATHAARFDAQGPLLTWTSWNTALGREMHFYQQCPEEHCYPRFVSMPFLDGEWKPLSDRTDTIPATQDGMGIVSYLNFYELRGKRGAVYLKTECAFGVYLVQEALTPAAGEYPHFTRSIRSMRKAGRGICSRVPALAGGRKMRTDVIHNYVDALHAFPERGGAY